MVLKKDWDRCRQDLAPLIHENNAPFSHFDHGELFSTVSASELGGRAAFSIGFSTVADEFPAWTAIQLRIDHDSYESEVPTTQIEQLDFLPGNRIRERECLLPSAYLDRLGDDPLHPSNLALVNWFEIQFTPERWDKIRNALGEIAFEGRFPAEFDLGN